MTVEPRRTHDIVKRELTDTSVRSKRRLDIPTYLYPYMPQFMEQARPEIERALRVRKGLDSPLPTGIIEWAEQRFRIAITSKPIVLMPHQVGILRLAFTRDENNFFKYRTFIYSTIKQSGKTSVAGLIAQWYAETGLKHSKIYCIGNDKDQAKTRAFEEARVSIELHPDYDQARERLPGEWDLRNKESYKCLRTGTVVRALAVDARGEAGGKPAIQLWTEVWGVTQTEGIRFWDELTPIPTIPDSIRVVETYAGYLQESVLLYQLYETGQSGHQLTAGELHERTGVPLDAFAETQGNPDALIPIWENKAASMLMYWDSGINARRMPWQIDERGKEYYRQQELTLPPPAFRRLHGNEWVSAEAAFIRPEAWDACQEDIPRLEFGDKTPCVMGVDAATTNDCFAIVLVSRHPDPARHEDVAVRALRVYDPRELGGLVDYDEPDRFIRFVCQGGHVGTDGKLHPKQRPENLMDPECPRCQQADFDVQGYNVVQVAYDPYQLEKMMQDMRRDSVTWCEPFSQAGDRLKADRALYDMILRRNLAHDGNKQLREHVLNAGAKVQKDEDSTLRLIKIMPNRKIDAVVALSMASARCLYLTL